MIRSFRKRSSLWRPLTECNRHFQEGIHSFLSFLIFTDLYRHPTEIAEVHYTPVMLKRIQIFMWSSMIVLSMLHTTASEKADVLSGSGIFFWNVLKGYLISNVSATHICIQHAELWNMLVKSKFLWLSGFEWHLYFSWNLNLNWFMYSGIWTQTNCNRCNWNARRYSYEHIRLIKQEWPIFIIPSMHANSLRRRT